VEKWREQYRAWLDMYIVETSISDEKANILFSKGIDLSKIEKTCSILGKNVVRREKILIVKNDSKDVTYVFSERGTLSVRAKNNVLEETLDAVKLTYRSMYCTECLSCVTLCPTGSVSIGENHEVLVNPITCIMCRACLDVCPIADVMVEKIVSALILNKYDAWRRETKRKREEVAKFLEKLLRVKLATKCPNIS
ncbi:MAG: hypothetical protein DRN04_14655, partial [Thermoprotei archaeon]